MKKIIAKLFFATHKKELDEIQAYFIGKMDSLNSKVPEHYHEETKAAIIAVAHVMRLLGAPGTRNGQ